MSFGEINLAFQIQGINESQIRMGESPKHWTISAGVYISSSKIWWLPGDFDIIFFNFCGLKLHGNKPQTHSSVAGIYLPIYIYPPKKPTQSVGIAIPQNDPNAGINIPVPLEVSGNVWVEFGMIQFCHPFQKLVTDPSWYCQKSWHSKDDRKTTSEPARLFRATNISWEKVTFLLKAVSWWKWLLTIMS